ncbi:MAG: hypothetical protein IPJ30_16625 [Acidobacteria bacterium]|nr:hypothetical protein [Acidobacteriota bacterium]
MSAVSAQVTENTLRQRPLGSGKVQRASSGDRDVARDVADRHEHLEDQSDYGETDSNGNVDLNKNTGSVARQTVSFAGLTQPFVQTYRYDSLYRINEARETQGAQQTWKQTWEYDRFGNRMQFASFAGTTQLVNDNKSFPQIDPATNRFNPNQGYRYDKNGTLIANADGLTRRFQRREQAVVGARPEQPSDRALLLRRRGAQGQEGHRS